MTAAWVFNEETKKGVFTGNPTLVEAANRTARSHRDVSVFGTIIPAGDDRGLPALSALFAYFPGENSCFDTYARNVKFC